MPIKWLCTHCKKEIIKVSEDWVHAESGKFVCNTKAEPRHQTVATKRIT
jgi:hypothetical protein